MKTDKEKTSSPFKPMGSNTSLHILVYRQLKELIISGELKPGDRLLEYEIASQLNTSKTPIREAIRELASEGLVVHEKRKRITVVDFTEQDVREILTLRAELEVIALGLATQYLDESDYKKLSLLIDELKEAEAENDFKKVRSIDIEGIHAFIVNKSGNSRLEQMWKMLASQMMVLFQAVDFNTKRSGFASDRHSELLNLMQKGETEKAADFIRNHVLRNLESIVEEYASHKRG
ncbi:MAG: GntR family transcriptional regulator [Spirochaetales bacterium]|nr:GntR family transcriptional regulator [Spirochaetales bacterium]